MTKREFVEQFVVARVAAGAALGNADDYRSLIHNANLAWAEIEKEVPADPPKRGCQYSYINSLFGGR